jgi:hypothetical protein
MQTEISTLKVKLDDHKKLSQLLQDRNQLLELKERCRTVARQAAAAPPHTTPTTAPAQHAEHDYNKMLGSTLRQLGTSSPVPKQAQHSTSCIPLCPAKVLRASHKGYDQPQHSRVTIAVQVPFTLQQRAACSSSRVSTCRLCSQGLTWLQRLALQNMNSL